MFLGCPLTRLEIPKGVQKISSQNLEGSKIRTLLVLDHVKQFDIFLFNGSACIENIIYYSNGITIFGNNSYSKTIILNGDITDLYIGENIDAENYLSFPPTLIKIDAGSYYNRNSIVLNSEETIVFRSSNPPTLISSYTFGGTPNKILVPGGSVD